MKIYQIRGPLPKDEIINLGTKLGNSNYYIRQIGMEHPYSIPILITVPKSNKDDPDIFLHTNNTYNIFLKINDRTQYRIPDRGFLEFENLNAKAGNVTLKFNEPLTFYDCITIAYE
jgi:hypothetical protein